MAVDDHLAKAQASAELALAEAWPQFEKAIHETGGCEPAGITISVRYKPGKESETKSVPPTVEVVGRVAIPTNRARFEARDSGGQLHLSGWGGE